jgi:FPC/CPF motif-containing protein YcgG
MEPGPVTAQGRCFPLFALTFTEKVCLAQLQCEGGHKLNKNIWKRLKKMKKTVENMKKHKKT